MSDNTVTELHRILVEVDQLLRERVRVLGVSVDHVILAIGPDGSGVLRSNVGDGELEELADVLTNIAEGAAAQGGDNGALH